MKKKLHAAFSIVAIFVAAAGLASLHAQTPTAADPTGPVTLSQADLEQLVAPIALYPDPLIALILPASTVPTDIVLADRFVKNGGDTSAIDSQNWDPSVKGLAHYPDVLAMMDENLDWTNQLGAAVLAQQADVMTAIQSQRAKAQALGNLQSTPQQQVVADQQVIQIVPADPQVIYVPVYDPQVVYVQPAPAVPFITFGIGFAMGAWIGGDCDWHNHGIYRGGYYRPGYGWGSNNVTIINNNNYIWRPNPNKPKPRPPYQPGRPGGPGGGNGHLPGWRPPPGNRPPGNTKPQPPGGNRPGGPGNRPNPGGPQIQPVPGHGQTKPAPTQPGATRPTKPTTPTTRPGFDQQHPNSKGPVHTLPAQRPAPSQPQHQAQPKPQPKPEAKPQPKPQPRPEAKPAPTRPAPQPSHQSFNQRAPDTKRPAPAPHAQPKAQRPANNGGPNRKQ